MTYEAFRTIVRERWTLEQLLLWEPPGPRLKSLIKTLGRSLYDFHVVRWGVEINSGRTIKHS